MNKYNTILGQMLEFAIAHVKTNHEGAKISRKKLTMQNQSYFPKRPILEGKGWDLPWRKEGK